MGLTKVSLLHALYYHCTDSFFHKLCIHTAIFNTIDNLHVFSLYMYSEHSNFAELQNFLQVRVGVGGEVGDRG